MTNEARIFVHALIAAVCGGIAYGHTNRGVKGVNFGTFILNICFFIEYVVNPI